MANLVQRTAKGDRLVQKAVARQFLRVLGSEITTNKQQILFHLENSDSGTESISMPIGESLALVDMIAAQHNATFPTRGKAELSVLPVKWFELGRDQEKNLVVVLTLRSGGKLTFSFPRGLDNPMREVLAANASLPPGEQSADLLGRGGPIEISHRAVKSSGEIRTFWFSMMALGTAISMVGVLAQSGLAQNCELVGGLAILLLSITRLFFLKSRLRKRSRWGAVATRK